MNFLHIHRRQAVGVVVSSFLLSFAGKLASQTTVVRPTRMPAMTLFNLDGTAQNLSAFQGKVLMVNLWATWCPPCRAEMPSIEKLHQTLRGSDFVVLGINQGESAEKIKSKMGIFNPSPTFPILVDQRSEFGTYFGVKDLPMTLIFNKKGILVGVADGARDFTNASVRQNIEELLKQ
jgi:thiol-disulfide isomerase/thioredoxin